MGKPFLWCNESNERRPSEESSKTEIQLHAYTNYKAQFSRLYPVQNIKVYKNQNKRIEVMKITGIRE